MRGLAFICCFCSADQLEETKNMNLLEVYSSPLKSQVNFQNSALKIFDVLTLYRVVYISEVDQSSWYFLYKFTNLGIISRIYGML